MSGTRVAPLRTGRLTQWRLPWQRFFLKLNPRYRELERILDRNTLTPQLAKLLRFMVVKTLEGGQDQLTEHEIADKVFGQQDLVPSEKSVVRVEKRRLREKLKDYYEDEGRGDPVIITLDSSFVPVFTPAVAASGTRNLGKPAQRWRAAALIVAAVAVSLTILWYARKPSEELLLSRLTAEPGFATDPAISPDGKLVTYASDRGSDGNLDIWVQNIATGDRMRLAPNPADDYAPSFSPDGARVVFHSDRDGGGVYTAAVLGGGVKWIARQGQGPRYSPDGRWIVYWVGEPYFVKTQLFIVSSAGGAPKRVAEGFYGAHDAVWSPDGKRLLFWGQRTDSSHPDWWLASLDAGEPLATGAFAAFAKENLTVGGPAAWMGDEVFFSARRDTVNLWKASISRTGKIDALHRLTFGTDEEGKPSIAANGNIVFSSVASSVNVWSLPMDVSAGKAAGPLRRLTRDIAAEVYPSIARNNRLVFSSDRTGKREIWSRDLLGGAETMLAASPSEFDSPKITPDGSKVAYAVSTPDWAIHVISGADEKVYKGDGPPSAFSADGTKLLYEAKTCSPYCVGLLDLATGVSSELIRHPQLALYPEDFSPDTKWVAFQAKQLKNDSVRTLYVAPFHEGKAIGPEEWIAVTDGTQMDREAKWSPDGGVLYFLSERDGFRCIWAQRLDRRTMRPLGKPFAVEHFHHSQQSLASLGSPGKVGLSVTPNSLVFSLAETTGNIWIARTRR